MNDPLEEMYHLYKTSIFHYLLQLTFHQHTAEELTHDTFLKAFRMFTSFRGEASIKTWLYRIARNTYLDHVQKKSSALEEQTDFSERMYADSENQQGSLDEKLFIQHILSQLTEKERTLIVLRDKDLFTYREIGLILNMPEAQVKVGIFRARKKFKEYYIHETQGDQKNEA
ncbi:RNA polymerase sigma factor [Fictibacillus aquaticus]|nr:RNA polymerase sigma factor [Fictibacillus aquaticus]